MTAPVTLAEAKAFLRVGHDGEDGLIQTLIEAAQARVEGDLMFHLDPLWAHDDLDYVGIDWYPPLGDWRAGDGGLASLRPKWARWSGRPSCFWATAWLSWDRCGRNMACRCCGGPVRAERCRRVRS